MRRTLSIGLIALILFNTMGYYGILFGLQYHNNKKQIATLDAQSDALQEPITIKIPINIPYATDSEEYHRVNGVFEYKGEFFRLVKQRIVTDTLEVVLIKDLKHQEINNAFVSHAQSMDDDSDNGSPSKTIQLIKEYTFTAFSIDVAASGWSMSITPSYQEVLVNLEYISSIIQPPELI